jgi:archaellum biogenesis protein FlaJ (TadC family)
MIGVFVLASIIAQLDPVSVVFTLAGAASSLGVVILMTLVSVAMLVFFRRVATGKGIWHTLIAPIISTIGLAVILLLVVTNFSLLTGTQAQAYGVMGFVLASFVVGSVSAVVIRRRRPDVYARLDA